MLFQTYGEMRNAMIEQSVYENLQRHEEYGSIRRMDELRSGIARLQRDEASLQMTYQELLSKRNVSSTSAMPTES